MGRTIARWVLVALCLTWSGASAGSPPEDLTVPRNLEAAGSELRDVVAQLRRDGLPSLLVVRKVQEGSAKGIAAERVLAAARGVASDLRLIAKIARKRHVRPDARRRVISAGVVAHRAGIPLISIDALVGAAPREAPELLVMALHAAADLGGRGYPRDATANLVLQLLRGDRSEQELPRALAVVESVRKASGEAPERAISKVASGVENGQDLQEAGRAAARQQGD